MGEKVRIYITSDLSQVVADEENNVLYQRVPNREGIFHSEPAPRPVAAVGNKDADFYQKGEQVMIRSGRPGDCQILAGGFSTVVGAYTLPNEKFDKLVLNYQKATREYEKAVADTNAGLEGAISEAKATLRELEIKRSNAISEIPRPEVPDIVKMLVPKQ